MGLEQIKRADLGLIDVLAVCISWSINHSIIWALIHGLLGWIYVLYYALGGGR